MCGGLNLGYCLAAFRWRKKLFPGHPCPHMCIVASFSSPATVAMDVVTICIWVSHLVLYCRVRHVRARGVWTVLIQAWWKYPRVMT